MKVEIQFDGGCTDNGTVRARGRYGWVAYCGGSQVASGRGKVVAEVVTNNVAEWEALRNALLWLKDREEYDEVKIYGDSKLVVNQLCGKWRCKKPHLDLLRRACLRLLKRFKGRRTVKWIPRRFNQVADSLCRVV